MLFGEEKTQHKISSKITREENWWNLLEYDNAVMHILFINMCSAMISIINLQLLLSEYRELEREDNSIDDKSTILVRVTSFANSSSLKYFATISS